MKPDGGTQERRPGMQSKAQGAPAAKEEDKPRRGLAVVVSGPSGSGKSTLCRIVRERTGGRFSVSATTRPPRPGEQDGVDYLFLSREAFEAMRQAGELLEYSEHFGNFYGTPRQQVEEAVAAGDIIVLDIDVNGANQVRQSMPAARLAFILPPSREELEARLRARGTEDEAALALRLERAAMEMAQADRFDVQIVNDSLDRAADELARWIEEAARAPARQPAHRTRQRAVGREEGTRSNGS